jgi:hypothetical protein
MQRNGHIPQIIFNFLKHFVGELLGILFLATTQTGWVRRSVGLRDGYHAMVRLAKAQLMMSTVTNDGSQTVGSLSSVSEPV